MGLRQIPGLAPVTYVNEIVQRLDVVTSILSP